MVRERSMSRYMSTAVDSAGLIVTFNNVGSPTAVIALLDKLKGCHTI